MSRAASMDVSVVIPAYNRSAYIAATLASVAAQTLRPREVIVVDDGSQDDTARIAEEAGVRVLRQQNRGISAARNAGMRAAGGAWIAFLDSDDLWIPEKLEMSAEVARLCPSADLIFSDMEQFEVETGKSRSFLAMRTNFADVRGTSPAPDVLYCDPQSLSSAFHRGNFINPSTLVVRRDLLESAGPFDEDLSALEDREFVLRLLRHGKVAVSKRQLVRYRMHADQFSSNSARMLRGALEVADRVFERPERYPPGSVEVYRDMVPGVRYALGIARMEVGDFRGARRLLGDSLRERWSVKTAGAFLISLSGRFVYQFLRLLKRHLNLPGLADHVGATDFGDG